MQVKELDPGQAARLSALLDQALQVPPFQREAWLSDLKHSEPLLQPLVAGVLASLAAADDIGLLETAELVERRAAAFSWDRTPLEGRQLGPYRVLRLLGQGGMGSVWLAERDDGLFERQVALKLLHPGLVGRTFSERFARERRILAALDHPHIGRLLDAGFSSEGQPYLALEYVEGTPLTHYCDDKQLDIAARVALVIQVLSAVQYLHQHLVLHRDLKPSNILVTHDAQVRLLDFGIAKLMADGTAQATELTQIDGRPLTPDYASPEQISGDAVSTASDVYSVGVLLYELLCGQRPYRLKRGSRGALEEAILAVTPVKPSQLACTDEAAAARATTLKKLRKSLAGDLDTIVLKALKKSPGERYATVDAFRRDLQHYLNGEPVAARPDGVAYRARKFVLRHRWAVLSLAAVFGALGLGLGTALWQARVADQQARTAAAVQDFLEDIFRANSSLQPDPVKARETSARELLDLGAAKVGNSLRDAPAGKVQLLGTLANLYDDLGLSEQAVALGKQRVALAKATFGPQHPIVADALIDLAGALHESAAVSEREAVLRDATAILDREHDRSSRMRAELDLRLAELHQSTNLTQTIAEAREGVKILRSYPPSFSLVQLLTMQGIAHDARREYREAESVLIEAARIAAALPSGARRTEPIIHAYLGEAQFKLGDLAAAEASYRQGLRSATSLRGPEHEDTIQTEVRLGSFLVATGRAEEGLKLLQDAKALVLRTKGAEDTFHLPRVLASLGDALIQQGRPQEGVAELDAAIALRRRHRGGTRLLATMLESEAAGLAALGRRTQADAALNEASAIRHSLAPASETRARAGGA